MRILISGGAGFIGSHLTDALMDDHKVQAFDSFLTGSRRNTPDAYEVDITDREALYVLANERRPEVVIHCAASYSDPDKWHRDAQTNVEGGINAALVAKHHGAHLIYFQTILPPISSYAISKIAAEQYMRLSGVSLTVLRLANIYGPRNLSGPIPVFYKRLTTNQPCVVVDTTREMVYIDDLVRAVMLVVEQRLEGTFDVWAGEQTEIIDLYQGVAAALGGEYPYPPVIPPDPDDVQGRVTSWEGIPGWIPTTQLGTGIARTVLAYEFSGVSETHTHLRIGEKDAS